MQNANFVNEPKTLSVMIKCASAMRSIQSISSNALETIRDFKCKGKFKNTKAIGMFRIRAFLRF